jgi:long-subunit acyl-CoA synthetase (AMP-forming)
MGRKKTRSTKKCKPTFEELIARYGIDIESKEEHEPVNAHQVYHFFHTSGTTSRSGGGTLQTKNMLRAISVHEMNAFMKQVAASDKSTKRMFATCHYAHTITKVPLGAHVLGQKK